MAGASVAMAWRGGDAPPAPPVPNRRFRDLTVRTIAGLVLAAVALAAILAGPWGVVAMTVLVLGGIVDEWRRLVVAGLPTPLAIVGGLYLLLACFCFCYIYFGPYFDNPEELARNSLLWFLGVMIANDCLAYGVGRIVGGPKLMPRISPKKTWSGAVGGIVAAALAGAGVAWAMAATSPVLLGLTGLVLAVVAQIGDLAESRIKRLAGVKDSGSIIPGHGGILDRVDGIAAAAIALGLAQLAAGTAVLQWQ
jgi:phosphatidate cytidylyltransferase